MSAKCFAAEYGTATPWEEDIDFDIYLFIYLFTEVGFPPRAAVGRLVKKKNMKETPHKQQQYTKQHKNTEYTKQTTKIQQKRKRNTNTKDEFGCKHKILLKA